MDDQLAEHQSTLPNRLLYDHNRSQTYFMMVASVFVILEGNLSLLNHFFILNKSANLY